MAADEIKAVCIFKDIKVNKSAVTQEMTSQRIRCISIYFSLFILNSVKSLADISRFSSVLCFLSLQRKC